MPLQLTRASANVLTSTPTAKPPASSFMATSLILGLYRPLRPILLNISFWRRQVQRTLATRTLAMTVRLSPSAMA